MALQSTTVNIVVEYSEGGSSQMLSDFGDGERNQLDGPYSSKSTCQTFGSIQQESGF
jgi:hypothetical protein